MALLKYVLLFGLAVSLLYALPKGGWMLSDSEREGLAQGGRLQVALDRYSRESIATEIGAASAYASGCNVGLSHETMGSVLSYFGLEPADFDERSPYRPHWLVGAQRVAALLALDGGDSTKMALACTLAVRAYGRDGTLVPVLLDQGKIVIQ